MPARPPLSGRDVTLNAEVFMCVWSAYAGKCAAAPVLWESFVAIEGIWGGFYTGMVTLQEGVFHSQKCAGHSGVWAQQWSLVDFPGNAGMIHSRTNSGGDQRRAHPFIGCHQRVALVSQGSLGRFQDDIGDFIAVGNRLLQEGRSFNSASKDDASRSPFLADGNQVSLSDIVVNEVEAVYEKTGDMLSALRTAGLGMREESATIFLFADRPGTLGFINLNQHLVCNFSEHGVHLSVTALGLPGAGMEIPGNSVGWVTADGLLHREELSPELELDTRIPDGLLSATEEYLRHNSGVLLGTLCDAAIRPKFPHQKLEYCAVAAYRVLETLLADRRVRLQPREVPGPCGCPGRVFGIELC